MKRTILLISGVCLTLIGAAQNACIFDEALSIPDTLDIPCNECGVLEAEFPILNATTSYTVESIANPAPPYPTNVGTSVIGSTDDVYSGVIPIGFPFCFFGQTYTGIVIGSNGVVTFDASDANGFCPWSFNAANPSPVLPTNAIFGPFHDINPATCGNVRWEAYGEAPCRTFVVSFDAVCMYSCTSQQTTSQIVIYEATNIIEVYIVNKPGCGQWNSGNTLIGIQNAAGTVGYSPPGRNTGNWSANNEAWRFVPSGEPDGVLTWFDAAGAEVGTGSGVEICPDSAGYYYAALNYNLCGAAVSGDDCVNYTVNVTNGTWPAEVNWDLVNSSGVTVLSGGAGFNGSPCLPNDCYTLEMFDSFGDGWNGAQFQISYQGTTITTASLTSGSFGTANFCVNEFVEEPDDDEPSPLDDAFLVDSVFVDIATENLEIALSAPDLVCTYDTDTLLVADIPDGEWSADCGDCIDANGLFTIEGLEPGDYTVFYAVQGTCDIVVDSSVIAIEAPPVLTFENPDILCAENDPVNILSNVPNGSWEADCGDCIDSASGSFDPSDLDPGTYEITYTAGENCPTSASTSIQIDQTLTADLTPVAPFCETETVEVEASNPGGFWSADCGACINSETGVFDGNVSGDGVFTVTYDFDSFCSIPVSTLIEVDGAVDATIGSVPELCETGDSFTLTAADAGADWSADCTGCINGSGTFDPQVSGPGTFTVTSEINGVCSDSDEAEVVVLEQTDATITLPAELCLDAGTYNIASADPGGVWSTNDCFGCLDPESGVIDLANAEEGVFQVTYTIEGLCGSEDAAETFLFPCEVDAPNIFTPNGDGDNDALVFNSLQYFPDSRLEVRNRWGQLVYENDDYGASNNWQADGVSDGTYFYILMIGGTDEVKRGTLTIRR